LSRRRRAAVLVAAAALDLAFGEPPGGAHPVVWLGRWATALERHAPRRGQVSQLLWGAAVAGGLPLTAAVAGDVAQRASRRLGPAGMMAEAMLLKPAFATRALLAAGEVVRTALERGELEGGRAALRSLVSRSTDRLDSGQIAAAAIESLAENATDSFLAPWLAYALWGLPGAYAYRAVNTLDSMFGYRGPYEYLGKAAAGLDDLVNRVPSRATALLLALAAPAGGGSTRRALRTARRDRGRTASPNAGWTMAAMAGALGVRLEKVGAYVLGDGNAPTPADIQRAQRIVTGAGVAGLGLLVGALTAMSSRRSAPPASIRAHAAGRVQPPAGSVAGALSQAVATEAGGTGAGQ
jgi:adenosylcobinamide-phosphate synthase